MNLLSLAHFTSFLICAWLFFFILSKNPKALPNRICTLLIICYAVWNFAFSFFQASASDKEARLWLNISSIGWSSFAVLSILLTYVLTIVQFEKKTIKWYFYPLILLFPVFFIYLQWNGYLIGNLKTAFGWGTEWSSSIWPLLFFAYYISFLIYALFFGFFSIRKRNIYYEKKRAKSIIISTSVFLIAGTITDVLLPLLKIYIIPPIGSIFSVFLGAGIVYSITRYRFMSLTPAFAASDILSTMSDLLVLISPEGKVIEANNAVFDLLGYRREELIGSPAEKIAGQSEMLLKEISFRDKRFSLITKKGEFIPVSFSGSAMKDKEDNYIGIVGVARDMRKIMQLQERERELAEEKARIETLQENALELQDAYNKLKATQTKLIQTEKMAAVGQLAGGVAHEINNPMGVILGFSQSIMRRIKEDDPLHMPLKSIEREAIRCRKLIVDLLTFSRAEKTKAEKIDINQAIEEMLSLIEAGTKVKNIDIIKEYGSGIPGIIANKNQIQQIIVNLCNNAIDAMPDGGKIKISTLKIEDRIELKISDSGKGMTRETMRHIFEPFFTTKEAGKGTGLGLSLCYDIIKKHNGTVQVESVLKQGTVFTIKLPLRGL